MKYDVGDLVWIPDGTENWKSFPGWMEPELPIKGPIYGLVLNSIDLGEYHNGNGRWLNIQIETGSRVIHEKYLKKIEQREEIYG
tara:strand:- start:595 stop:846 length:252 start_codon:yes stop_codon:yes gene_type:complete